MTSTPRAPDGAGPGGRKLWRDVLGKYELEQHELALLLEMVRIRDRLDALHAVVAAEGLMVVAAMGGTKAHPALVEARQQGIAFARLAAALRLPAGDEGDEQKGARRPQRRVGARGVYSIRGGAA